jgi:multiple sugar transport system substrate-binding protein/putative aldouronate transport system substrate-binding protein
MELINWLCTPDGIMTSHYGPQGVTWDYDRNSKAYLTPLGIQIQDGNPRVQMPESAGGGMYQDGENKINNTTFTVDETNPVTGERYNKDFWSSELSRVANPARSAWQQAMNALNEDQLLEQRRLKSVVVASDYVRDVRSDTLEQMYVQVSTAIKTGTWRAIYASSDAEFNRIVADMVAQAKSFGYDQCVAWDTAQGRLRATAVRRALANY